MPDGSVVTVPPAFTKDAVFEALLNGIKTVVIVTERIPRRDVAQMVELADMHDARIIGPNCLGLIVPGVAKMGGIGGPAKNAEQAYQPGQVGVMSRSGGMTTEISSTLTAAGLGVSTAISIGGDAIIGSTYAELMPYFEADEQTEAIVIYTEPGGRMEAQLAEWVAENDSRLPIVAFMAGRFMDDEEMQGMSFGHAGTIVEGKEDTATEKIARLEAAGIPVVERIDEIPDAVKAKLAVSGIFIDVEVADEARKDPELAKKLEEACPVDIFAAKPGGRRRGRGEPRRVHPVRAVHGGRAAGQRCAWSSSTTAEPRSSARPSRWWPRPSRPSRSGSSTCSSVMPVAQEVSTSRVGASRWSAQSRLASPWLSSIQAAGRSPAYASIALTFQCVEPNEAVPPNSRQGRLSNGRLRSSGRYSLAFCSQPVAHTRSKRSARRSSRPPDSAWDAMSDAVDPVETRQARPSPTVRSQTGRSLRRHRRRAGAYAPS